MKAPRQPFYTLTILGIGVMLLGAGCMGRLLNKEISPSDVSGSEMLQDADQVFQDASSSEVELREDDLIHWDITRIDARHLSFEPPAGYWVYRPTAYGQRALVPGVPPVAGSPDPKDEVLETRVAILNEVIMTDSFPNWDRFQITMAQFNCAEGDTDETFIVCLDEKSNIVAGVTEGGLPYEKFSLPLVRNIDQAPRGKKTFVMIRLGNASQFGYLITALNEEEGADAALKLAKSMSIER